jgi:hypothetical protein
MPADNAKPDEIEADIDMIDGLLPSWWRKGEADLGRDALNRLAALARERDTFARRADAAKKRLGDLKAVHSRWYDGKDSRATEEVVREMEHIAYSVYMYLDGQPGPYLPAALASPTEAASEGRGGVEGRRA